MLSPVPRLIALLALLLSGGTGAHGQGHQSEIHEELGLRWSRPNGFRPVPVSPGEEGVLLRFLEKASTRGEGIQLGLGQVWVVELPRDLDPKLGCAAWLAARFQRGPAPLPVELPRLVPGETNRHGLLRVESELRLLDRRSSVGEEGYVWILSSEERRVAVLGFGLGQHSASERVRDNHDAWAYAVGEIRFLPRQGLSLAGRAARFAKRGLSMPEMRARTEASLVKGWSSEHTPNFSLIYGTKNRVLIDAVASELEVLRTVFLRDFQPVASVERPALVRIFQDATQYFTYGAPLGTGGYYSPATRELVLFDNARRDGILSWDSDDTRAVLYHEAFHQYIHDAVGDVEPHTWFDEGTGEYYGASELDRDGIKRVGLNERRAKFLRELLSKPNGIDELLPWRKLTQFTQAEFYRSERVQLCYAQAWAMIHFLRTSEEVAGHPEWGQILPRYYGALTERFADEARSLPGPRDGAYGEALEAARRTARREAHEAAFGTVEFDELEAAWHAFLRGL